MRETQKKKLWRFGTMRITPAYAGNTPVVSVQTVVEWGSPPRMRETQSINTNITVYSGITPAYAGNTVKIPLYYATPKFKLRNFHLLF